MTDCSCIRGRGIGGSIQCRPCREKALAARRATPNDVLEQVAVAIHEDRQTWAIPQHRRPWDSATEADKVLARSSAYAAIDALAAATRRAKTRNAAECEASQSGPKGNAQNTPGEQA